LSKLRTCRKTLHLQKIRPEQLCGVPIHTSIKMRYYYTYYEVNISADKIVKTAQICGMQVKKTFTLLGTCNNDEARNYYHCLELSQVTITISSSGLGHCISSLTAGLAVLLSEWDAPL
jgi:hypothetical protein